MTLSQFYPSHAYGVVGPGGAGIDTAITAAGATQATATLLVSTVNVIGTVASGTGVILPPLACSEMVIANRGAHTLAVYPALGGQIESLGTNVAAGVVVGAAVRLASADGKQWTVVG